MDHAFPLPPSDPCDNYIFKPADHFHKSISREIIAASIWGQASKKSPAPDAIGPATQKLLWSWDSDRMTALCNTCTRAGLHPRMWKCATGVVIAKPGKDDYSKVKSYRVICLLSCRGKYLECIITDGISAQLEANGGLHWGQFGGRKQRSAVDAVAYVMNQTQIAWNNGQIAGLLLINVKGAFDHVNYRRLLTTVVAEKLDGDLIEWTEDFLTNRTVQITVDGFDTEVSQINTRILQGSPVSPILFVTYLSCLFPFVEDKVDGVEGICFADDVGWWVSGEDIGEIRRKIEKGASLSQQWVQNNAVVFDIVKRQIVLLSRRQMMNRASKE
jgi:hypothetical protein